MSEKYAKFLESPFNNIPPLSYDNHPRESGEPFFKVAFEVNVRQDWGGRMVVGPCPGRGIKEIAIADRCTINWPATIIRGASSCVPRRQADTKDTRYLYDADAINFARNNVQFRHLINRGRTAIVGLAAFRAAGSPADVCSRW